MALIAFSAIPVGLSVTGCGHKAAPVVYCNASDTGPTVGQVANISLSQTLATTGVSLNYQQIGQGLSASATDCKGNSVSVTRYVYATSNMALVDINPSSGQTCAGIWNRNTGGGIADYTVCGPYLTAPPNYTPVPVTPPTVLPSSPVAPGPSPYTFTATVAGTLSVQGGVVSNITTTTNGKTTTTNSVGGQIFVIPNESVTITYTVPPTLSFAPAFTYTATSPGTLTITGGTVSGIAKNGTAILAGTTTNATSGIVVVQTGDVVAVGYTTAPTIYFFPAGVVVPVNVSASPFVYTATVDGTLAIAGGVVSTITITHNGTTTTQPSTSGLFTLHPGDVVTTTYTVAPAAGFIPFGAYAYVTASADGATSNAIVVYVHPIVTGIVLGGSSASCLNDPGTDCCPNNTVGTTVTASPYTGNTCISQHSTGQLIAHIYQSGNTAPANNITCQVGHISFAPLTSSIVSIDENGIATANLPGSTLITATVSNSSTGAQAGFFSTCPPATITLENPSTPTATSLNVNVNNLLPLTAVVKDTNGVTLNGLTLEYNSTTPQTIPATTGSVTPAYPGTAVITAVCLPGSCNPAPFSQIGLYGNGQPLTSNGITINAVGKASDVIYMGSTSSQYILPRDFTLGQPSALIKLPYLPNSMVITQDGSSIYLGSAQGLMSINTASNAVGAVNVAVVGKVLAVSPDGTTVVVTDPTRQTISLYSAGSGAVTTSYGGIGTSAKWSPDSQTVYVTLQGSNQVLTHTAFTNWQATPLNGTDQTYSDVAVMVPSVGAFFAGGPTGAATEGRSYCPSGTVSNATSPPTVTNNFAPLAAEVVATTDKIAATNDGKHILGATASTTPATLSDIDVTVPSTTDPTTGAAVPTACIQAGAGLVGTSYFTTTVNPTTLAGITATVINGIVPAANSTLAFVTYQGASGLLPEYLPAATGPGTLKLITLGNGATAASAVVSGVFSTDGLTFFAGTSSDDQVHLFTLSGTTATESSVITPALPLFTGQTDAGINLLVQKPKKTLN